MENVLSFHASLLYMRTSILYGTYRIQSMDTWRDGQTVQGSQYSNYDSIYAINRHELPNQNFLMSPIYYSPHICKLISVLSTKTRRCKKDAPIVGVEFSGNSP